MSSKAASAKEAVPNPVPSSYQDVPDCTGDDLGQLHQSSTPNESAASVGIIPGKNAAQLQACIDAYKDAEHYLKIAELNSEGGSLYIPSVNELRYYGFHLNQAFLCSDESEQFEELKRAERHCNRAAYDAIELGLLSYLDSIQRFQKDYRKQAVTDVVSDYPKLMSSAEEIKSYIENERHEDRASRYKECEEKLTELKAISRELEHSRSSLNAKRFGGKVALIVAVLGVIGAFSGWYQYLSVAGQVNDAAVEEVVKNDVAAEES